MRMVVLEGPDGAGKSTLATELITKHGFAYWHATVPKPGENVFETYTKVVLDAIEADRDIVFDRLNLCQCVYGSIMRGEEREEYERVLLERLLFAQRARIVVCLPPLTNVIDNWSAKRREKWDPVKRTGDYVDAEAKIIAIYDAYKAYRDADARFLTHDYRNEELHNCVMDYCLNWCGDHGTGYNRPLPSGVLGSVTARFLVVGEQVNKNGRSNLPFYSTGVPSRYLTQCLHEAGFRETSLAFVNAVTPGGTVADKHRHRRKSTHHRDLNEVIEALPSFQHAIALGETAERVCKEQKISYFALPHPAFMCRFHRKETPGYVAELRRVRLLDPMSR